ncbi:MAG: NAD(P)-dependent oxidoreductase [Rhodocyclaceae bacterium]|nr:NAD(P)-dependent oxidoreductase [Rhodocyclaceae bacterium]
MIVGFVGLGAMGRPMAENVAAAGHTLRVWSRRPESSAPLVEAGATVWASPREMAEGCDVVVTVVTNGEDVLGVSFGEDGILAGLGEGGVHVDMSTIAPGIARELSARYAQCGAEFLDAPVSGGTVGARAGTLAIMVGGDEAALERAMPVLEAMGKTIRRVGPSGAGQVAKACNQMIFVTALQACAEAMHLAEASGVDPVRVREALLGGSAWSRALEVWGDKMVTRDFSAGVESRLHHKDFRILMNEAMMTGVPLPVAAQVWQQLNAMMHSGYGREDTSSLLRVLEQAGKAA